ncbi:PEF-CTERM sorting domain-containing protein [Methanolobus sp. ZRKC3]
MNVCPSNNIPEFPTIALPILSIIGMMFLFHRRKGK